MLFKRASLEPRRQNGTEFTVDDKANGRVRVDEINKEEEARAAAAKEKKQQSAADVAETASSSFQTSSQRLEEKQAIQAIAGIIPGTTA